MKQKLWELYYTNMRYIYLPGALPNIRGHLKLILDLRENLSCGIGHVVEQSHDGLTSRARVMLYNIQILQLRLTTSTIQQLEKHIIYKP
jgi:hypothetical protein